MFLIKNLVKETEKVENKLKSDNEIDGSETPRPIIKSALDLQRLKLEKLMKNPDKAVIIPEPRKEKDYMHSVPSFVRNVMGSSAGAGSGEFHVYRHLRRKEYARQKMIQNKSAKELLDEEYRHKLEDNRRASEEKTAKKRAKRLKKRNNAKKHKKQACNEETADAVNKSSSDESVDEFDLQKHQKDKKSNEIFDSEEFKEKNEKSATSKDIEKSNTSEQNVQSEIVMFSQCMCD